MIHGVSALTWCSCTYAFISFLWSLRLSQLVTVAWSLLFVTLTPSKSPVQVCCWKTLNSKGLLSLPWFLISGCTGTPCCWCPWPGHLAKVASTLFLHSVAILSPITISVFWGGNLRDTNLIFSPFMSFIYLVVVIRVCICVTCVCPVPLSTCGDQRPAFESGFSPSTTGRGDWTQVVRLAQRTLCPLSHLTSLLNILLFTNFSIHWFFFFFLAYRSFVLLLWQIVFCSCFSFYILKIKILLK